MIVLFKRLLNYFSLAYNRAKGVIIEDGCRLSISCDLARGFDNGTNGSIVIGGGCELAKGVVLKAYGGSINISKNTFLGEYVVIYGHGGVSIGENTLIAMHTCIVSANHTVPDRQTLIRSQADILLPVKIGNDVWIGAGSKILGGITIGDGCVIGAGAVVTKDLPPYSIAVGIPAQVTGSRND